MRSDTRVIRLGAVSVYAGEKSGKYPDGNQVTVRGADSLAAFDTPLVANRLGAELLDADLVVLGHVHEDHMAGLHRLKHAPVHVHETDVEAARSWDGLARHYGYVPAVLAAMRTRIEREFSYAPRPDAQAYSDGASWDLGGDATSNLAAFRRTLEAVKHIPAKVWITSHHKGVITDRETFLVLLKAFAARLDALALAGRALDEGGCWRMA